MDRVRANNAARPAMRAGALVSLLVGGLVMAETPPFAFDEAWNETDAIRKQASGMGHEWLETGALLEQARKAWEAQQEQQARALLEQARRQAEQSLAQAQREQEAWHRRVVR